MKNKNLITLVGMSLVLLAGCNGTTSSTTPGTSTKPETSTETQNSETPSGTKEELVIGAPTAQKTWVQTEVNAYLASAGLSNKYSVSMYELGEGDAGSVTDWTAGPDLYAYASDQVLNLVSKGALATVPSDYTANIKADMTAGAVEAAQLGTKLYGYPYAGDNGYFLYYNKSVFTDISKLNTVDDVASVCGAAGLKFSYILDNTFYSTGLMFTFGARYNVTLSSDSRSIAKITADFNTAKGLKAAKAMKAIINNTNIDTTAGGQKAPTRANGIGACVDGSWNASKYKEALGDDYGCVKLPTVTVDGETKNLGGFLGYKLYGVNPSRTGTSADRQAVLHDIAHYLVYKDEQTKRFADLTIAPTNKEVAASQAVQNTPHVKALAAQAEFCVAQTIVPGHIWDTATNPYAGIVANKDATDAELQALLDTYNTAVTSIK